jgi:hypothetical protein
LLLWKHREKDHAPKLISEEDRRLREALLIAVLRVEKTVQRLCHPAVSWTPDFLFLEPDPTKVRGSWQFDDPLGAAYLQIWSLMTSAGDLIRYEYCGRIVSLARSRPEGTERRSDKRFCNDACHMTRHREKARERQGKRS